jgi:hypothetical protein
VIGNGGPNVRANAVPTVDISSIAIVIAATIDNLFFILFSPFSLYLQVIMTLSADLKILELSSIGREADGAA